MDDRDLRDQISELEERVEELAESLDRCRKMLLASKLSIAVGVGWTVATLLGFLGFNPLAVIVSITAVIGGIVLWGSTATTAEQISSTMRDAEAHRAELISRLELRVVDTAASEMPVRP